jgi:hypothetical protein
MIFWSIRDPPWVSHHHDNIADGLYIPYDLSVIKVGRRPRWRNPGGQIACDPSPGAISSTAWR